MKLSYFQIVVIAILCLQADCNSTCNNTENSNSGGIYYFGIAQGTFNGCSTPSNSGVLWMNTLAYSSGWQITIDIKGNGDSKFCKSWTNKNGSTTNILQTNVQYFHTLVPEKSNSCQFSTVVSKSGCSRWGINYSYFPLKNFGNYQLFMGDLSIM